MKAPESFLTALKSEELELSARQLQLLELYMEKLLETNRQFNLTAVRDQSQAWSKHALESVVFSRSVEGGRVADLGSGGGLPGIPLAIIKPELSISLVESVGKKARFLEEIAKAFELDGISVFSSRAEELGRRGGHRGNYDTVVARALGSLAELVELSLPLLKVGGRLLAIKGQAYQQEIDAASNALKLVGGRIGDVRPLLKNGSDSVVIAVVKTDPTPEKYPRRAGMPKKRPL